jgi:hypothetical protein
MVTVRIQFSYRQRSRLNGKDATYALKSTRNMSKKPFRRRISPVHAKQVRNGQCFESVLLSQTNRKTGYLRSEDREISIDEMSKFDPSIVGYMSKRSVSGPYFVLVRMSRTNRKTGCSRSEDREISFDEMSQNQSKYRRVHVQQVG